MEYWQMTAAQIATMVRTGQVSAADIALSHLGRIDYTNHEINAIVQVFADETMRMARAVDAQVASGKDPGPLAGVPITIKVNVDQAGHATTNGLKLCRDLVAEHDSPVVTNLRNAGAVIVGRTNTPAFSLRWFCRNDVHGETLNPHGAGITPGGSSGGAAAATAAGFCVMGHGTDIGGSIRYPAYACGLFGLRPTLGRVGAFNASGAERHIGGQIMAVSGPLTRSIEDIELSMEAMIAPTPDDPWHVPAPLDQGPFERRVTLCEAPDGMDVAPDVRAALRAAATALAAAGWQVDEATPPPMQPAADINAVLWMAEMRMGAADLVAKEDEPDSSFVFGEMLRRSEQVDAAGLLNALQSRATHIRAWQRFFDEKSLLLCPISGEVPFDRQADQESPERFEAIMQAQLTQVAIPALGLPGLSVPVPPVAGRPMGVQLIAGRYREDILIAAARDIAPDPVAVVDPQG
ncbi:MAG: amidase family protein [Pseudomonadota bacterium]